MTKIKSKTSIAALCERTWTHIGSAYTSGDDRGRAERAIMGLRWQSAGGSHPAMPGMGISAAIEQLRLPKVDEIAYNGGYIQYPDGGETCHGSIYGIQCHYSNGRVRVYVLDIGSEIIVLATELRKADEVTA